MRLVSLARLRRWSRQKWFGKRIGRDGVRDPARSLMGAGELWWACGTLEGAVGEGGLPCVNVVTLSRLESRLQAVKTKTG